MKYWNNWFFKYLTGNDPLKTISVFGIHFRRIIYPVLRRLDEKMCGMKKVVVSMGELPKGPKIYAATHTYSAEDVKFAISTAGESVYLMTNGRSELLYDVEGIAMWLVGVILVDRYDKENRAAALRKAERVLGHGGNILIFPEGVWNMSPNLIVRKLYSGIWKMACSTKAPVIPVATMIYEGTMYISRGKAMDISQYTRDKGLQLLRDELATMKYEIMEKYGKITREELLKGMSPEQYWNKHIEDYIKTQVIYEREEEEKAHYMDRDDIEQQEAFKYREQLIPSLQNAFLFRK